MYHFKLPDLGEGIHEGEILKWYVQPGQTVEEDAPLVEVETDKAAVTIPSPVGGEVIDLGAKVGDVVMVGAVIVVIQDGSPESTATTTSPDEAAATAPVIEEQEDIPRRSAQQDAPAPAANAAAIKGRPVPAAPATRRLARELGVDLRLVIPSGPAGRVTPEDVQRSVAEREDPAPIPVVAAAEIPPCGSAIPFLDLEPLPDFSKWGEVETTPLRSIRRKVAHKMVTSMVLVPHVAHMDEADVTLLEDFRKREQERRAGEPGGHLTLLAFVIKAVTAGLRAAPAFNASLDPFKEEVIYKRYYNIGIAVDTGRGLVVPAIKDTDRKSIMEISRDIEEVVERARQGKLEVEQLKGGTFTITNVGPLGGTALIPAINYPEVAILGMGRVQEKPVVRDGEIVVRKMLPLTLSFDHRIADGADAARFVSEMVQKLSDPNLLLLET